MESAVPQRMTWFIAHLYCNGYAILCVYSGAYDGLAKPGIAEKVCTPAGAPVPGRYGRKKD